MRDDPAPVPASAYALLALLTALNVLSWIDRQIIPAVAPMLISELGLSRAQVGLLYGYGFILCFIAAGLALGRLADRTHRPRLIAAGLAVWSVFTGLSGIAGSFAHLAAARVMVGIGEASLTPAALSMLSDAFPARWHARAAGIFSTGLTVGAGFSLVIAGIIAPRFGWRAPFLILGVVGVVAALLVMRLPDPRHAAGTRHEPGRGSFLEHVGAFRAPALFWTTVGGTLVTFSTAATIHVVTWLVEERGFAFQRAALLAGGIYVAAGTCGNVLGGLLADYCASRWRAGRLISLVGTQAVLAPAALLFFVTPPGTALFYAAWALTALRSTVWYGPLFTAVQDLAPSARATAVAFLMLVINLLGTGPGPWIAGAIGDRWSLTDGLIVTTWVGVASIGAFWLAARAVRRASQP